MSFEEKVANVIEETYHGDNRWFDAKYPGRCYLTGGKIYPYDSIRKVADGYLAMKSLKVIDLRGGNTVEDVMDRARPFDAELAMEWMEDGMVLDVYSTRVEPDCGKRYRVKDGQLQRHSGHSMFSDCSRAQFDNWTKTARFMVRSKDYSRF